MLRCVGCHETICLQHFSHLRETTLDVFLSAICCSSGSSMGSCLDKGRGAEADRRPISVETPQILLEFIWRFGTFFNVGLKPASQCRLFQCSYTPSYPSRSFNPSPLSFPPTTTIPVHAPARRRPSTSIRRAFHSQRPLLCCSRRRVDHRPRISTFRAGLALLDLAYAH